MKITLFGIAWFILLAYAFFKKQPFWIITTCFMSMLFQSASVVILNESGVGPQIFSSFALVIWCIKPHKIPNLQLKAVTLSKSNMKIILFTLIFLFVVFLSYKANQTRYTDLNFILYFLQLVIYATCSISLLRIKCVMTLDNFYALIYKIIWFVAIVGIIQFLTTTGIFPRHNAILEQFLYTEDTDSAYYWYDFYPRVFATFMEPSYCAPFLVGGFYFLISKDKLTKKEITLAVLLVLEILLTFSSTAYVTMFIVGLLFLFFSKNRKILKYIIPLAAIVLFILLISGQLIPLLNTVIFNKLNSGSGYTREVWNKRAKATFENSEWIGGGYKTVRGSQFLWSILGQTGIIGLLSWVLFWINPISILRKIDKKIYHPMFFFFISVIVAMLIAIPDIDYIVFWLSIYFLMLCVNVSKNNTSSERS